MKQIGIALVLGIVVALGLTRGGEANAAGGDATEMWFVTVQDGAEMFVGSMATEQTCSMAAAALARDRHAQGNGTRLAVFDCRPRHIEQH